MNLTDKQIALIDTIMKGNPDGTWLDLDQVLERLPYTTTKDSLQFSLRILIGKGLIEKKARESRRGQQRRILAPTTLAYTIRRS
jgi:predicted transcriptional regulator